MANERKRYKTSELIRENLLTIGDGYRATNSELGEGGIPFARAGNINDGFNFGTADLLKPASVAKAGEKVSQSGDVVFTSKGTVGRFAFVRPETPQFAYSPQLCYWRSRNHKKLDPRFLFYWMQGPASWSQINWAKGQTDMADYVSLRDQRDSFWLDLPTPDEQRRIAHILGALDDKIELNRQLNATLEELARSLFQSWFVDFDPVRAKASGEPEESICRRLGLTPELLTLFPATFQSSAMGKIPAGWKITSIGEAADVVGGGTPSTAIEDYWHKGTYHWATPKDLSGLNSPMLLDTDRKITEKGVRNISSGLLPRDTVLLSSRAPVGYLAISAVPISINQGFIALRCNGPVTPYYAYMWCLDNMTAIKSRASGTTFLEISKKSFRPMPVLIPDKQIMLEFTALVELLFNQIEEAAKEAVTLASLRDELLPELLSGQIKLS